MQNLTCGKCTIYNCKYSLQTVECDIPECDNNELRVYCISVISLILRVYEITKDSWLGFWLCRVVDDVWLSLVFVCVQKKVVIAAPKKQRVLLRFLWLEKNIGIALDQVVPGHGTIPLSPYFFWPRKDAWEQLKTKLDSKGWISRKRTIILLNQATDIINLWQANAANL